MKAKRLDPNQTAIAIFAKAPIEDFAKTRLIPLLGAGGAAKLQQDLIARAVEVALAARLGPVSLWCAPDCTHPYFQEIAEKHSVTLHAQMGKDLGARMTNAFATLTQSSPALLMGTDCVAIDASLLARCGASLRDNNDAVFLPVEDGGYILIGLKRSTPELFRDVPWTTERVMAETRKRAREAGLMIDEPEVLWDIDRPEDYARATAEGALKGP